MYGQLYEYFESYLNDLLCDFRKAHSTQHALFGLIQSWEKELNNSGLVETKLTDVTKAYDCLPHHLLIAKLKAYIIDKSSLNVVNYYVKF